MTNGATDQIPHEHPRREQCSHYRDKFFFDRLAFRKNSRIPASCVVPSPAKMPCKQRVDYEDLLPDPVNGFLPGLLEGAKAYLTAQG